MDSDLTSKTDEELETIVRRAENTNIPGSLFQRAKIELELRDRKEKASHDLVEAVKIHDTVEKRVKRGKESWNFFWLVFGILLASVIFIISILPFNWAIKILIFSVSLVVIIRICLISTWWQNKLIGLKKWLEDNWKKL